MPDSVPETKRTANPQFRRRFGYSTVSTAAPTRASTSYPTRPSSQIPSFRSTTVLIPLTAAAAATTTDTSVTAAPPSAYASDNTADQSIEPSHQDSKFTSTRYNQIGEQLSDDLIEAITTISRAPLPARLQLLASSTLKYDAVEHTHGDDSYEEPNDGRSVFTRPFQRIGISTTSELNCDCYI